MAFDAQDLTGGSGGWPAGGRRVSFRIDAGRTQAVFAGDFETEAPRVEGNITATARFQGEESGLDLTPDTVPEIQFSVRIRALPEVRFTRSGGVVRAGDEIELGLGLVGPYAEAIVGSLLAFDAQDLTGGSGGWPAGGRRVSFRIDAGRTQAVFAGDFETQGSSESGGELSRRLPDSKGKRAGWISRRTPSPRFNSAGR